MKRTVLKLLGALLLIVAYNSCEALLGVVGGEEAPNAPSNVMVTPGSGQVTVSWSSVSGAISYTVYYLQGSSVYTNSPSKQTVGGSPCTISSLTNGVLYAFIVTASNDAGESMPSQVLTATPTGGGGTGTPPPVPTNVQAAGANRSVTLSWSASEGATSYTVYWAQGSSVTTSSVTKKNETTTSTTVSNLNNGVQYAFTVTATGDGGTSAASSIVVATPMLTTSVPGAPVLTAQVQDRKVTLSWSPVTGATSYNLYWMQGTTVTMTTGTKVTQVSSGYMIQNLTNDRSYTFILTAVNAYGEGNPSAPVTATPIAIPSAPNNLIATAQDGKVELNWDPVANADWYNVYFLEGTAVTTETGISEMGVFNPYPISGLTNGTEYTFIVTAVNSNGESTASAADSATPVAALTIPEPPSDILAQPADGKVVLNWTASSGATLYYIYYKEGTSVSKTVWDQKFGTSALTRTIFGLINTKDYAFVVTASNTVGESAESYTVYATPFAQTVLPPAAPTNVTLSTSSGSVMVSWPSVLGATSYNLYYSTSGGTETTITYANSPYTVSGLTNDTDYNFQVAAVNSAGPGERSVVQSARPEAPQTIPDAPSTVWVQASDSQVTVYWNPVEGASSYNMYFKTGSTSFDKTDTQAVKITGVSSPFTKYNLANGTTYGFIVTAVNSEGEGASSYTVTGTPFTQQVAPPTPLNVSATALGIDRIYLTWAGSSSATSYYIYRGTTPGSEVYLIELTPASGEISPPTSYTDQALTPDTPYYYVVTADNEWGESSWSYEAYARTDSAIPPTPTGLDASIPEGSAYVSLAWNAAANATYYEVWRSTVAGYETYLSTVYYPALYYTDSTGTPSTTYFYRIRAGNTYGTSSLGNEVYITTPQAQVGWIDGTIQ